MSLREPKRFGGKTTLAIAIAGLSLGMTSPTLLAQQDDEALVVRKNNHAFPTLRKVSWFQPVSCRLR